MFAPPPTSLCTIASPSDHEDLRSRAQVKSYAYSEIKASELFGGHYPPPEPNAELNRSTPCTSISSDPTMIKKLYHNANERDRRKKLNNLYLTLRSLLEPAADQTKKLSIPATVSRVVKFIPELRQQVEGLIQKKEVLLSSIPRLHGEQNHMQEDRRHDMSSRNSLSAVSTNWLNDSEVAIQLSTYKVQKSPLAEILFSLEEDGFLLLNASSFESFRSGRVFYNLHLQVERTTSRLEREVLNEKLQSLCGKGKEFNHEYIGSMHFNDLPI
ncbi:hypothetical protein I3760_11G171500 [Carya illinoinensis]|uniref:BHLH domain-containing protein n=2 Tax=Carya illinoinensis TaxID=32201 RepID=A0A922DRT7_CARIL|nr:transcription factor ORG2-like [Carya illinoinensis]KAG2682029.1 hypothetical protein I3760_11G171500 [Carya illinoinensis]KAG6689427.1 hypothetical protein I3842_11G174400 [Carya illinoinensis]